MSELSQAKERPIGVTILAILAGIAAVLAAIHALQFLGIWLAQMLWRVERQAWLFLVMITMFYLILDLFVLIGAGSWEDVAVSVILNAIILLYCMFPGVRSAFGTDY